MNTTGQKFGGRKKGTPNKMTTELKESLQDIVNLEIQQLPTRLNELEAKDRILLLTKLLPYVLPKQSENLNIDKNNIEPLVFRVIDIDHKD